MSEYQVIARKFRPQTFKEVIGQEAVVKTLKNAIKSRRLSQAYLFCGPRGTGKTTLARLLAKAINCQSPTADFEPCNHCPSCKEITGGFSLDVLEIDGASHRGIEDIRQINETVGYATSGNYKVYIIDEVHMLTKEAFNALLKTLEEPPAKVKFLFATTEPHKVLPTIVSRCQRFNLNRISLKQIIEKLRYIAQELQVEIEEEALLMLARHAEGGLRDAESLFDQILSFHSEEARICAPSLASSLGLMPHEIYFEIDRAGKEGNLLKAFEIADRIFSEGKDLSFFIEGLIEHLRTLALIQLSGVDSSFLSLADSEKQAFAFSASLYSREQCLDLIVYLLEVQNQWRGSSFGKVSLEMILLHVMRSHFRLPVELLVERLQALEKSVQEEAAAINVETKLGPPPLTPLVEERKDPAALARLTIQHQAPQTEKPLPDAHTTEDPTPTAADLGKKSPPSSPPHHSLIEKNQLLPHNREELLRPMHRYDTLMQFAAVELDGRLQKNGPFV